jgi:hypothetical protein
MWMIRLLLLGLFLPACASTMSEREARFHQDWEACHERQTDRSEEGVRTCLRERGWHYTGPVGWR